MQKYSPTVNRVLAIFSSDTFLRDSGVVTLGAGISKALTLLFFIAAARSLDTAEYGVVRTSISWAMVATTLLAPLAHMFTTYLAKYAHDSRARALYLSNGLAVSGLFLAITVIINGVLSVLTDITSSAVWFVLFGLAVFHLYTGFLRGNFRFLRLAVYQILQSVLQIVTLVLLIAFNKASVYSVLVIYGSAWIITALVLEGLSYGRRKWSIAPPSRDMFKELLSFSVPLIASYAIHTLLLNGDILILRIVSNETQVGYYGVANSLAATLLFIANSAFSVILPTSSRLSGDEGLRQMRRGAIFVGGACLVTILGFWVAGDWIIKTLFSPRYLPSIQVLKVLVVGMGFYSLMNVMSGYWIAHNRGHAYALVLACTLVSALALYILFIPAYGALGAAISFTGATFLGFVLMLISLGRIRQSMNCQGA